MSLERAVQIGVRSILANDPAVTALVPVINMLDRNARPTLDPSIVFGESMVVDGGDSIERKRVHVTLTVHIWKRDVSLLGVKDIDWAVREAFRNAVPNLGDEFHSAMCVVASSRSIRDPGGEFGHGIMTIELIVQVLA